MKTVMLEALTETGEHLPADRVHNVAVTGQPSQENQISVTREVASPLHEQISDALRQRIVSAQWPAHYRLAAEPVLAADLGVSRGTLRRALATLIDEGLLRQVQGRGTFVTSHVIEPAIAQRLSSLSEDLAQQGISVRTDVLSAIVKQAPENVAGLLGATTALELRRLRSTTEGPVALLVNYVRVDLAPGIDKHDFRSKTLFGVLEGEYHHRLGFGRRTFSARIATQEISGFLNLAAGAPVQYLQQVTYLADGTPIEYSDVWINSSMIQVTSLLARKS